MMEMTDSDKHSSFAQHEIKHGYKQFYSTHLRLERKEEKRWILGILHSGIVLKAFTKLLTIILRTFLTKIDLSVKKQLKSYNQSYDKGTFTKNYRKKFLRRILKVHAVLFEIKMQKF